MKKNHFHTPLPAIILLTVFFFSAGSLYATSKMPAFSLPDVTDGKTVDSQVFQGKVLLVTFFATWCPPCLEEVPGLIKLQKEFAKDGFSVIGLSMDAEGPRVVLKLIREKDINYPVVMADSGTIRDFGGVYGIPTSFLVNRKGNVVKIYSAFVSHSVLVKDIKSVME